MENIEYENLMNKFWELHQQEQFEAIETVLYYALLHTKHKQGKCIIAFDELCDKIGIKGQAGGLQIILARATLIERGLISFNYENNEYLFINA